jgi:nitrous oxidase accessory protein NosD
VFGYGTDGLQVSDVSAFNDGGYGIARFNSTWSVLRDNQVSGNAEAGLYVGDSPDAETGVTDNGAWNNGYGVFVRHAHQVVVSDNEVWANCLGVSDNECGVSTPGHLCT